MDSIYADPPEQSASLYLHYGDVTDGSGLRHVIEKVRPQEIYNLAAQSHVRVSFDQPEYTADVVARYACWTWCAITSKTPAIRYALSGGVVGNVCGRPAAAKRNYAVLSAQPLRAQQSGGALVRGNYREAYGLFISNGILYNHES